MEEVRMDKHIRIIMLLFRLMTGMLVSKEYSIFGF